MSELKQKYEAQISQAGAIIALMQKYPDLKEHRDRWGTLRLTSKVVNSKAELVLIKHNCGCCSDSPLEVWPYIQDGEHKIFSDPPCYTVGEKNAYKSYDEPYANWEEKLLKEGIAEKAIAIVKKHFSDIPLYIELIDPDDGISESE